MKTVEALKVVWSRSDSDLSGVLCVTHDESIGERIASIHRRWFSMSDAYEFSLVNRQELELSDRLRNLFSPTRDKYALIISHPHGRAKKITVGKVMGKLGRSDQDYCVSYRTATCPGSSGAPVFPLLPVSEPRPPPAVLRHYVWGFVHSGTDDSISVTLRGQVNYGNNWY